MLATGGCRSAAAGQLAVSLGHTIEPPVPSLFTFHVEASWIRALAGISVANAEVAVPSTRLREQGPILLTHAGLSGPAILRLSAWGARELHECGYKFRLHINWLPALNAEALGKELDDRRASQPAKLIVNAPISPLAARLWEALVLVAGIPRETRWAQLSRAGRHSLIQALSRTELQVVGKTLNQDEFVTCGGVRLSEVNFKTMESRICRWPLFWRGTAGYRWHHRRFQFPICLDHRMAGGQRDGKDLCLKDLGDALFQDFKFVGYAILGGGLLQPARRFIHIFKRKPKGSIMHRDQRPRAEILKRLDGFVRPHVNTPEGFGVVSADRQQGDFRATDLADFLEAIEISAIPGMVDFPALMFEHEASVTPVAIP